MRVTRLICNPGSVYSKWMRTESTAKRSLKFEINRRGLRFKILFAHLGAIFNYRKGKAGCECSQNGGDGKTHLALPYRAHIRFADIA